MNVEKLGSKKYGGEVAREVDNADLGKLVALYIRKEEKHKA